MLQLDEERKQELIMAKQIRRDTVVINGGTGNTTTREVSPFVQHDRSRSRQTKIIRKDQPPLKSSTKIDIEAVKKATNPIALRYWNQCVQQSTQDLGTQSKRNSRHSQNYELDETGNVAPPWLQQQPQPNQQQQNKNNMNNSNHSTIINTNKNYNLATVNNNINTSKNNQLSNINDNTNKNLISDGSPLGKPLQQNGQDHHHRPHISQHRGREEHRSHGNHNNHSRSSQASQIHRSSSHQINSNSSNNSIQPIVRNQSVHSVQPANHRQQSADQRQQSANHRQQTDNHRQQSVDQRQQSANHRQHYDNHRQQSVDNRQQSANHRQQSADNRQQLTDHRQQSTDSRGRNLQRRNQTPTVEHNAALPYPVLIETSSSKSRPKLPLAPSQENILKQNGQNTAPQRQDVVSNGSNLSGNILNGPNVSVNVPNGSTQPGSGQQRRLMKRITIKAQSRSSSLPPWSRQQQDIVNGVSSEMPPIPRRGAISPSPASNIYPTLASTSSSASPLPWCRNESPSRARLYANPPPWCRGKTPSSTGWASNPPPWCRVNSP